MDHDASALNKSNMESSVGMAGVDPMYDNWYELRFSKIGPDRRGYHSSFIHGKK